jgi:hypothetical protein
MAGEKTVTRRRMSANPRSPWHEHCCSLRVGWCYAVCPGRGREAIGRVLVTDVRVVTLGDIDEADAGHEGFADREGFVEGWTAINGGFDHAERVWRIEFERSRQQ